MRANKESYNHIYKLYSALRRKLFSKSLTNFQCVFFPILCCCPLVRQTRFGVPPCHEMRWEKSRQNITFKPLSLKPLTLSDDGDLDDWDEEDDFWGSSEKPSGKCGVCRRWMIFKELGSWKMICKDDILFGFVRLNVCWT